MSPRAKPARVAIVGGGCAAMAAAWELTHPRQNGRFEVTVYQLGWRLGGKGASGRGPAMRIEEHGLHLWMGYYENAFRLMRDCYAELGRDPRTCPIADWTQAFSPTERIAVADQSPARGWLPWLVKLPPSPGQPGDPVERFKPPTVRDYLVRTVGLVRSLLDAIRVRSTTADRAAAEAHAAPATDPVAVAAAMARFLRYGELLGLQAVVEALRVMEQALAATPSVANPLLLTFHGAVMDAARDQIARCVGADDEVRRLWEIVDVAMAVVRGSIKLGAGDRPARVRRDRRRRLARLAARQRRVRRGAGRRVRPRALRSRRSPTKTAT